MKELIGFPVGWLVGYLLGSFVFATFDISLWSMNGRFSTVVFSTAWGAALAFRARSEYLHG